MSYYKVKSMDLRDWNDIKITAASSNVRPIYYSSEKYTGSIENLFQDLLSGNLKINPGNRQKVHAAYLQSKLYLRHKEVNTYELYKKGYNGDVYYERAFEIFKDILEKKLNKKEYYIQINGKNLHTWRKYGYAYSYHTSTKKSFIDLLIAQLSYGDEVTFQEVK